MKTTQRTTFGTALPRAGNIAESYEKGCSEALVKQGHDPITSQDALDFSGVHTVGRLKYSRMAGSRCVTD